MQNKKFQFNFEGILFCDKCNGFGLLGVNKNLGGDFNWSGGICENCYGKGQVDWTEYIIIGGFKNGRHL